MKRLILLFLVAACGDGSTTNGDGGADAAADGTANDATSEAGGDAAPSDGAVSDGSGGGDGGLNGGDVCDPNNNQCKKGLLCCNEPTHMADAMTGYFCEVPVNKSCPLLP